MRVYSVQIAQKRLKTLRLPATSAHAARVSAEFLLRPGDRIEAIAEHCDASIASGQAALSHLLGREYLDLDGAPMLIEDWLLSARMASATQALNTKLALAGLRLDLAEQRLAIGSASRVPVLHHWFIGTPWEGSGLIRALAAMPDAGRVNLTYAGTRSRAVTLPLDSVLRRVTA